MHGVDILPSVKSQPFLRVIFYFSLYIFFCLVQLENHLCLYIYISIKNKDNPTKNRSILS